MRSRPALPHVLETDRSESGDRSDTTGRICTIALHTSLWIQIKPGTPGRRLARSGWRISSTGTTDNREAGGFVNPLDPEVVRLAAIAILVLAASLIPARRVAAVDPMQALRNE